MTFGGMVDSVPVFTHPMTVHAAGDRLLALDSVALLAFDPAGRLISRQPFAAEAVFDLPRARATGGYIGERIVAPELRLVLEVRDARGEPREQVAAFDLREFFPDLKEGDDFFLSTPDEEIAHHRARRERAAPPFYAHVPTHFQIVRSLCAGPGDEVWAFIKSRERTGLARYDAGGAERGWYPLAGECDAENAVLKQFGGQFYFMVTHRQDVSIYRLAIP